LKRNQLCTPEAIDQDFNFITGVERRIERAGLDAGGRGIELYTRGTRDGNGGYQYSKGDAALVRATDRVGLIVDRAPKGMSRNKVNQTRWLQRSKQIAWSVEWRTSEGSEIQHDCLETHTVVDLYTTFQKSKEPKPKKRKVKHKGSANGGQAPQLGPEDLTGEEQKALIDLESSSANPEEGAEQNAPEDAASPPTSQESPCEHQNKPPESDSAHTTPNNQDEALPSTTHRTVQNPQPSPENASKKSPSTPSTDASLYNFYLHRPHTRSGEPIVLIPLPRSETLASGLRDKVVLEFPTIFVLQDPPDALPEGYVTEEKYLNAQKLEDLVLKTQMDDKDELERGGIDLNGIDEKKVLEVLRKDMGMSVT
jgi:hypothetical protein